MPSVPSTLSDSLHLCTSRQTWNHYWCQTNSPRPCVGSMHPGVFSAGLPSGEHGLWTGSVWESPIQQALQFGWHSCLPLWGPWKSLSPLQPPRLPPHVNLCHSGWAEYHIRTQLQLDGWYLCSQISRELLASLNSVQLSIPLLAEWVWIWVVLLVRWKDLQSAKSKFPVRWR